MLKTRSILFLLFFATSALSLSTPDESGRNSGKRVNRLDGRVQAVASTPAVEVRSSEDAPLFVRNLASPESEAEAAHKQYERHEKPALDRRLTIGTELLALFTFLLFCFTAGLWWVTYRLSRDARDASIRQSTESLRTIAIAQQAADAATTSAAATELAAQTMKSTASHQLRAYICIGAISGTVVNDRWRMNFEIKNVGSTIARRVNYSAEMQVLSYPLPADAQFQQALGIDQDIAQLGPGQCLLGIASIASVDTNTLSHTETQRMYLYGTIVYTDIFECLQETNFCYICNLDVDGALTAVNAPKNNHGT